MNADRGIRRAGTAGDEADAGCARQLAIGGCHEGCPTFVATHHIVQLADSIMQRIKHRQIALTRHSEPLAGTKRDKALDQ